MRLKRNTKDGNDDDRCDDWSDSGRWGDCNGYCNSCNDADGDDDEDDNDRNDVKGGHAAGHGVIVLGMEDEEKGCVAPWKPCFEQRKRFAKCNQKAGKDASTQQGLKLEPFETSTTVESPIFTWTP